MKCSDIASGILSNIAETARLTGTEFGTDKNLYGGYITHHWNWMNILNVLNRRPVEPWNACAKTTNVQQPHLCKHFALKCANNHIWANTAPSMCISIYLYKNTSTTNVPSNVHRFNLTWMCKHPTNVQIIFFIKNQPHLCKHFTLKCVNNHICHICANISLSNVQTTTFVQTRRPQMCKSKKKKNTSTTNVQHDAVKMCKGSILTWNVQTSHKCANHFFIKNQPHCANISPSNV